MPSRPPSKPEAASARIDDTGDEIATEIQWQVKPNYEDAEEGDSEWTLKARDQAGLERAQQLIKDAVVNAENMSHVGFLTLTDRSSFPRIVGTKGANVSRLRVETGADITVSRENSTIIIIGKSSDPFLFRMRSCVFQALSGPFYKQRRRSLTSLLLPAVHHADMTDNVGGHIAE